MSILNDKELCFSFILKKNLQIKFLIFLNLGKGLFLII